MYINIIITIHCSYGNKLKIMKRNSVIITAMFALFPGKFWSKCGKYSYGKLKLIIQGTEKKVCKFSGCSIPTLYILCI